MFVNSSGSKAHRLGRFGRIGLSLPRTGGWLLDRLTGVTGTWAHPMVGRV